MKLDKHIVKGMLEQYLAKEGHTLQELEEFIQTGVEKKADDKKDKPKPIGDSLKGFGGILGGGAKVLGGLVGLAGGIGGLGAYGAYKQMGDSDNKITKQQETIRKIEAATRELQAVKAQQQMGYSGL